MIKGLACFTSFDDRKQLTGYMAQWKVVEHLKKSKWSYCFGLMNEMMTELIYHAWKLPSNITFDIKQHKNCEQCDRYKRRVKQHQQQVRNEYIKFNKEFVKLRMQAIKEGRKPGIQYTTSNQNP